MSGNPKVANHLEEIERRKIMGKKIIAKDIKEIFPENIANFTRIAAYEIKRPLVKEYKYSEYESLQDVVSYTNKDCSVSVGIKVESFDGRLQLSVVKYDEIIIDTPNNTAYVPKTVKDVLNNLDRWGYFGQNDIGRADFCDIKKAKEILTQYLK